MTFDLDLDDRAQALLADMAREAQADVPFIARVAIYNLIACWAAERGFVDMELGEDGTWNSTR